MTSKPEKNVTHDSAAKPTRLDRVVLIVGAALAVIGALLLLRTRDASPPPADDGSPHAQVSDIWFVDNVDDSGIEFRHQSGHRDRYYFPEVMGGGVCLLDYDGDGFLDVYFVQGGQLPEASTDTPGNQLYRNQGDGTFSNVTAEAGVGDTGYGMGCAVGDYDNDSRADLYVTNAGLNVLYHNNGDGTFTETSATARVDHGGFSSSAAFIDFDKDGDDDLFVVNYVKWTPETDLECSGPGGRKDYCTPKAYDTPDLDVLYRNNGDGTFTDVSETAGLSQALGNGLGVVCADIDGDGWMDMVVANDLMANQLWINQHDGTFRDVALESGVAFSGEGLAEAGMGIDARDIDDDGDLDLIMTHFAGQTNTLYVNQAGFFTDQTTLAGLATSLPYTGFGAAMLDLNNDGVLDMYVANGRVVETARKLEGVDPYVEPNLLFEGLGGGKFREVLPRGGVNANLAGTSRGAAFGDIDNDGDIDIIVVNRDARPFVLENVAGRDRHWILFRVLNDHGGDAVGAQVRITCEHLQRSYDVRVAYSYCSSNDPRVHFGLDEINRVDAVEVTWTDGSIEMFGSFEADQIVELRKGQGTSP